MLCSLGFGAHVETLVLGLGDLVDVLLFGYLRR